MHIAPQQETRYEADAWEVNVARYLAGLNPVTGLDPVTGKETGAKPLDKVTIMDVAREALFVDSPRVGTAEQRRVSAALERMNWARGPRGNNGERFWVPKPQKRIDASPDALTHLTHTPNELL